MYVLLSHIVSTPLWREGPGAVDGAGKAAAPQGGTAAQEESHWGRRLLMTAVGAGIGFITGGPVGAGVGAVIGFGGGVAADKAENAINRIKKQQDENLKKALGE